MSKVRDKLEKKSTIKQIYMKCGRLPIDSSQYEWINPTTKVRHKGITLEAGDNGYVELNLANKDQAAIYERYSEWVKEGTDPRIVSQGVHELKEGSVKPPFTWWQSSKVEDLIRDVLRATDAMEALSDRESFVEQCVLFERGLDKPRKGLIEKLLDLELEVAADDPMNPKVEAAD